MRTCGWVESRSAVSLTLDDNHRNGTALPPARAHSQFRAVGFLSAAVAVFINMTILLGPLPGSCPPPGGISVRGGPAHDRFGRPTQSPPSTSRSQHWLYIQKTPLSNPCLDRLVSAPHGFARVWRRLAEVVDKVMANADRGNIVCTLYTCDRDVMAVSNAAHPSLCGRRGVSDGVVQRDIGERGKVRPGEGRPQLAHQRRASPWICRYWAAEATLLLPAFSALAPSPCRLCSPSCLQTNTHHSGITRYQHSLPFLFILRTALLLLVSLLY